jgi:AcrR family transcriptional regulator
MAKSRITKDPELRKNEIIDAAAELFLFHGFDETSVSDIVKKVGVAQGLFYYYFKSKDEVLNAMIERLTEYYYEEINRIGNDSRLNAVQKVQTIFKMMFSLVAQNEKMVFLVHDERNELLHYRLERKFSDKLILVFTIIIEQGVRERLFDVEYPEETATILLVGLGNYMHGLLGYINDLEGLAGKLRICLAIMEKALGASSGSFSKDLILETGANHE